MTRQLPVARYYGEPLDGDVCANLTARELEVLATLRRMSRPVRAGELAPRIPTGATYSGVSVTLGSLVRKGYALRFTYKRNNYYKATCDRCDDMFLCVWHSAHRDRLREAAGRDGSVTL